ncbi:tetratricopeptide repeat protein [Alkalicoccobacillus murimartini]|uniref:DNA-directed RNA polymerase beta' subunit n=1 Tax=Alkalicoccobacillus murimartini TaxID=171685 RepID=A0ABT9YDH7_9BACI|nr:hypothetical protein [Alkalicoccobacillus murimartini]MDQ0205678.1 DNA-directed RNA polymerase beta' subunit [Alkalicoccobacillus murimartini]
MKRYFFAVTALALAGGCSTETDDLQIEDAPQANDTEVEERDRFIESALDEGKQALSNEEYAEAIDHFQIVLDAEHSTNEALDLLALAQSTDTFTEAIVEEDWHTALEERSNLEDTSHYNLIESNVQADMQRLDEYENHVDQIDEEIENLYSLYDPDDSESIPDDSFLEQSTDVLTMPDITDEQEQEVQELISAAEAREEEIEEEIEEVEEETEQAESENESEEDERNAISLVMDEVDYDSDEMVIQYMYNGLDDDGYHRVQVVESVTPEGEDQATHTATLGHYLVDLETDEVHSEFDDD